MATVEGLDGQHDLLALHRYYLWANRFRLLFEAAPLQSANLASDADTAFDDDAVMFMASWYTQIHAVVEGWQELGLTDPRIDELLESRHVTRLRLFRDSICQFQRQYGEPQFLDMAGGREVAPWARELTLMFGNYFMEALDPGPA